MLRTIVDDFSYSLENIKSKFLFFVNFIIEVKFIIEGWINK